MADERIEVLIAHGWREVGRTDDDGYVFRNQHLHGQRIVIRGEFGWLHFGDEDGTEVLLGTSRYHISLAEHLDSLIQPSREA